MKWIILFCFIASVSISNVQGQDTASNVIKRLVDYVSSKCEMTDSTKEAYRIFMRELRYKLQQCHNDSLCRLDRLRRQQLMLEYKKDMRARFGPCVLKASENPVTPHHYPPPKQRGVMKLRAAPVFE